MILQIGVLGEASRADVTLEGPRTGMDVHVRAEVARRWEGLTAKVALVRLVLKKKFSILKQVQFNRL